MLNDITIFFTIVRSWMRHTCLKTSEDTKRHRVYSAEPCVSDNKALNAEPRFKGRPFAQLNLKAGDANGGALPHTEFALRSTAVASNGKTP